MALRLWQLEAHNAASLALLLLFAVFMVTAIRAGLLEQEEPPDVGPSPPRDPRQEPEPAREPPPENPPPATPAPAEPGGAEGAGAIGEEERSAREPPEQLEEAAT